MSNVNIRFNVLMFCYAYHKVNKNIHFLSKKKPIIIHKIYCTHDIILMTF